MFEESAYSNPTSTLPTRAPFPLKQRVDRAAINKCVVLVEAGASGAKASERARRDCGEVHLIQQKPDEGLRDVFGRAWLTLQQGDVRVLSVACGRLGSTKLRSLLLHSLTRANVTRKRPLLVRLHCQLSADEALPMWVPEVAERLVQSGVQVELRFDR